MRQRSWRFIGPLGLGLLAGCTLSARMPALDQRVAPAKGTERESSASGRRSLIPPPVSYEYNGEADLSRYSVVTHPGQYFLWIQHPRITFFVVDYGQALTQAPATVYMVFRTQSPQEVNDSRLEFTCGDTSSAVNAVPVARVEPGMLTSSLYQTFEIPVEQFRRLAACDSAELSVGGVRAPFRADNMAKLRSLAALLPHS